MFFISVRTDNPHGFSMFSFANASDTKFKFKRILALIYCTVIVLFLFLHNKLMMKPEEADVVKFYRNQGVRGECYIPHN